MYDFIEKHKEALSSKPAKVTSPARSSDVMDKNVEEFIAEFSPVAESGTIINNLFVFDETIIGDPDVKQVLVGERRTSGGGNVNVYEKRGTVLGCFLPFSRCDGTTPFRVFVSKDASLKNSVVSEAEYEQISEVDCTPELQRIYTSSGTGYITIPLFKYILKSFNEWWNLCNPGLFCYLVCDRLPVHVNDDVKKFAREKRIHIIPIMPGSSHWFQVHDQIPLADLKKKKSFSKKTGFLDFPSLHPGIAETS